MKYLNLPFFLGFLLIAFSPYYYKLHKRKPGNLKMYLGLLLLGALLLAWGSFLDKNWPILLVDLVLLSVVAFDFLKAVSGKLTRYEKVSARKVQEKTAKEESKKKSKPHFADL